MATSLSAAASLGSWGTSIAGGEDHIMALQSKAPHLRVAQAVRLRPVMRNVNEGKGIFAPVVVVARNIIGKKKFNQLRGKAIALHSQLNGENYAAWSRAMIIALSSKNKLGFVDGSISKPEEERQGSIRVSLPHDSMNNVAFMVKNNKGPKSFGGSQGLRKERPYCTKCKINGHTIDTCYKVHGYPPGYRQNPRYSIPSTQSAVVNQVSGNDNKSTQSNENLSTFLHSQSESMSTAIDLYLESSQFAYGSDATR